ncbi:hypothetical protein QTO34_000694 [Cnephaeus nilssonii]|uniref:L1 transposable element RRM domain-containing protein n=1 Tax=Cnephaeus nilssonii TaxID=3371016 RepID=A0AA40IBX6_CNENI|nr:hypothetical protein QTO34_000694 [Eptesicus nilssonii]
MRIIELPDGQEEQQGLENLFEEIMTENFPDMGKIKVTQVQRVPSKINPKRPTPRHVIISMANINDKERILKAARERQRVTYKRTPTRLSNDYSTETQQARSSAWTILFMERYDILVIILELYGDGSTHSHKMVVPSPLSPTRAAGMWHGWAHPQGWPEAQASLRWQLPSQLPRRGQASDGGCPGTQGQSEALVTRVGTRLVLPAVAAAEV